MGHCYALCVMSHESLVVGKESVMPTNVGISLDRLYNLCLRDSRVRGNDVYVLSGLPRSRWSLAMTFMTFYRHREERKLRGDPVLIFHPAFIAGSGD